MKVQILGRCCRLFVKTFMSHLATAEWYTASKLFPCLNMMYLQLQTANGKAAQTKIQSMVEPAASPHETEAGEEDAVSQVPSAEMIR